MDAVIALLNRIPSEAWTALGVALIAFFGVWVTNWNNRQNTKAQHQHDIHLQQHRIAKERLEELHIQVTLWSRAMIARYERAMSLMQNKTTLKEYNSTKLELHPNFDFSRLEMIVGMYGETVQPAFKEVRELINKMDFLEIAYLQTHESKLGNDAMFEAFAEHQLLLNKAINTLKLEIVKAAKEV
jgi:hypothetical protein